MSDQQLENLPSRQAQLRHTDPRLTEDTSWDEALFVQPHAEELSKISAIPVPTPVKMTAEAGEKIAPLMHQAAVSDSHLTSQPVTEVKPDRLTIMGVDVRTESAGLLRIWHQTTRPGVA